MCRCCQTLARAYSTGDGSVALCGVTRPILARILAVYFLCNPAANEASSAGAEGGKSAASCIVAGPASGMLAHLGLGQPLLLLTALKG